MQSLMGETPKTVLHRYIDVNSNETLDSNEPSSPVNEADIATEILNAIADLVDNGFGE